MNAFVSLIFFIIIASLSMGIVAYMNFKDARHRQVHEKLRLHKIQLEELEDTVTLLDTVCEDRAIPRLVNDEVIELYLKMIDLDHKAGYLEAGYAIAKARSQDLANNSAERKVSRLCRSDSQMARLKHYCKQATTILGRQHAEGKISNTELKAFSLELQWLTLQIDVISFIAYGHKAYVKSDVMTANAFYKKAQTALLRSNHPDERRHRMIQQVADILFGRRRSLDEDLMPETEFNPDESKDLTSLPENVEEEVIINELIAAGLDPQQRQEVQANM